MKDFRMYDPIAPQTAQEHKECETADGIRARFNRAYAYRGNPIVRAIFEMAHYRGLSGEDKYVFLSFELLKRLEKLEEYTLKVAMLTPGSIVFDPEK